MVRGKVTQRPFPTAAGGIARAAYGLLTRAGVDPRPLLQISNLTVQEAKDSKIRIPVRAQIKFLNSVADALQDEFLGIRLAESVDLRELGLLYYVLASSETLGDALKRLARYSTIHNEGIQITYREHKGLKLKFQYVGVARLRDRHQIEFFLTILLRLGLRLTGRQLLPSCIKLVHRRSELPAQIKTIFGRELKFGSTIDEVTYPPSAKLAAIVNADPYLNSLLLRYCDEALSVRRAPSRAWRLAVENAVAPLLPHGQADISTVAKHLGVSRRTLTRRLSAEGFRFGSILDNLRRDLAERYLKEPDLPISEIAWLLGYREISSFHHAFKRWTAVTPRQFRVIQ